jgi:hypothetical protein
MDGVGDVQNLTAAKVLVEHLFARGNTDIVGVEYAVGYKLAHGLSLTFRERAQPPPFTQRWLSMDCVRTHRMASRLKRYCAR